MIWTIDARNARHGNDLDVDLKITLLKIFQSRQKIMKNVEVKYALMIKVIVHVTTAKITATKRYMHLWHVCLAMTNVLVKNLVAVRN